MELVPFTHAEPASMRYLDALCETYPAAPSSEFAGQSGMETLRQDMLQNWSYAHPEGTQELWELIMPTVVSFTIAGCSLQCCSVGLYPSALETCQLILDTGGW